MYKIRFTGEKGGIKEKSSLEIMIQKASYGHPDNESTQAARRVLEKRGISYEIKNYRSFGKK